MQRLGLIIILAITISSGAEASWLEKCVAKTSEIAITGGDVHPYKSLVEALKLSDEKLETMVGKSLLSLGEGYSDLVPYLVWFGVKARGLDTWYHSTTYPRNRIGRLMENYNKRFGDILIRGDARDTKLQSNIYDFILSANLMDNFEQFNDKLKVLDEAIRILKVGGEARILGFEPRHEENLLRLQTLGYENQIALEIIPVTQKVIGQSGQKIDQRNLLVVIKKLGNTERKTFEVLPMAPAPKPPPITLRGNFNYTM